MSNIGETTHLNNNLDFYRLLGINADASVMDIKTRYKELTRLYHPDKAKNEDERETNNKLFEKIKIAYKVLTNENLRQQYTDLLNNKFENLKSEYANGAKEVLDMSKDFDLDKFNKEFVANNDMTDKNEVYPQVNFEEYKNQRENINIENKFEAELKLDKIKNEASTIYTQIEALVSIEPSYQIKYDPNIDKRQNSDLKALLNQFGFVRDNVEKSPILTIDFILACEKIRTRNLDIKYDLEFVQELTKKLEYKEYDDVSDVKGLTHFSDNLEQGETIPY